MDDHQIIALYWNRADAAIRETDSKYGSFCRGIAFNITGDRLDCEECVNDTYLRAWEVIPPTRPASLRAFLGRIVRNFSLDRIRRKTAAKRTIYGASPLDELIDCLPADSDTVCAADDIVLRDLINRFLASLPEETRCIFLRRYWYFSSIKDIARDYHMTESKIKMMMLRTREALRKTLEKEGYTI